MPSALRARVALVGLLAVLLIPIATSSLRGLTHVLTCQEEAATPFVVDVPEDGAAVVTSDSPVIEAGDPVEAPGTGLCGGLDLQLGVGRPTGDRTPVVVMLTNNSDHGWRGTVQLRLDDTDVPVDIGSIDPGATATDQVELRVRPGRSYVIEGSLLVGP
jgi:hypothetical protein